ncbi:glycosyltransferase family 2 protein [Brevundimonas sp.]|uniref:glycosyltransferase family 2 protein n=1 Tax=Brevundimonas sp. TaxID=1871086 RepID=UPI003D6CEC3A
MLRRTADAARDRGDWREAVFAYRGYLTRRPSDGRIWIQLGHALKEGDDLAGAADAYARAGAVLGETDADLLLSQGRLARLRGDEATAVARLVASLRQDRNSPAAADLFDEAGSPGFARWAVSHDWRPVGRVEHAATGAAVGWLAGAGGTVEFRQAGCVIGTAAADLPRPDLARAGLTDGAGGFSFSLSGLRPHPETGWSVEAVSQTTGEPLLGSPFDAAPPLAVQAWLSRPTPAVATNPGDPVLSLIMPVHDPRPEWLAEALASVAAQTSSAWELVCIDDGSSDPEVRALLAVAAARDARVRLTTLSPGRGVAGATNAGLAEATGDWVAFMDHDDVLEPEAVARLMEAAALGPDLVYSDEVLTHEEADALKHFALRPAFSHDYYLSHPYFVHMVAAPLAAVRAVEGLDETLPISADVDLILRLLERSRTVAHVPAVLYRWRTHSGSEGHRARDQVTAATQAAINAHLARLGSSGRASPGATFNTFRIDWPDDGAEVLAIIPTRNRGDLLRQCVESLERTTPTGRVRLLVIDHESDDADTRAYLAELASRAIIMPYEGPFNFARMNNEAVRRHARPGQRLLFLNNDIEALDAGWIERLASLVARPEVGVAGATLLYPDRRIQHAGVVLGLGGYAEHIHKFAPFERGGARNSGPDCSLVATREFSAVTAACMMMRHDVFEAVGGFDETFEVGFNDTDLCLRVGAAGYRVLNDGQTVLLHHESATRRGTDQVRHPEDAARLQARWGEMLTAGDPFYNPLMSMDPAAPEQTRLCETTSPRLRLGPGAAWSVGELERKQGEGRR